jgi:hypothetical protein
MEISIVLGLCLIASIMANIILVRLASWQSRDLTVISDSIGDLVEIIENYGKHLKDVYSLDAFYGDETLQALMDHTNAVRSLLEEQYGDVISITEPIEYEVTQEESDAEEKIDQEEKHVLYAGTRRRDS